MPKILDTAGDNWRDCPRTGMPGGIMLAACAPGRRSDEGFDSLNQDRFDVQFDVPMVSFFFGSLMPFYIADSC